MTGSADAGGATDDAKFVSVVGGSEVKKRVEWKIKRSGRAALGVPDK